MGKDSFLFHLENEEDIEDLTLEQKGMLFVAMITFTKDGTEPEFEDPFLRAAWRPIRRRMKADAENYEHTCEVNRANANKRWQAQKDNATASDRMKSHKSHDAKNANYADKDTDTDKDTDKDKDNINKDSIIFFNSAAAPEEKEKNQSEPFINPEVDARFEKFRKMRNEKGRHLNADSEKIVKDKIVKFSKGDPKTAIQIIDQAIEGGYLTVIPLQKPPDEKARSGTSPGFAQHDYDFEELTRRAKA